MGLKCLNDRIEWLISHSCSIWTLNQCYANKGWKRHRFAQPAPCMWRKCCSGWCGNNYLNTIHVSLHHKPFDGTSGVKVSHQLCSNDLNSSLFKISPFCCFDLHQVRFTAVHCAAGSHSPPPGSRLCSWLRLPSGATDDQTASLTKPRASPLGHIGG